GAHRQRDRRGQRRLHRVRRRLEVPVLRHLHQAAGGDREPGLHRLVVAGNLSRRGLLGMAGGTVVFLAGCGDDTKNPNVRTAPDESDTADVELLNSMLDLELQTIEAYKTAAGGLRAGALAVAKGFL